jgi:glycosyltransferase involved in cell wall biosynthesis
MVVFLVAGGELTAVLDAAGVPWCVARLPTRRISRVGRDALMVARLAYVLLRWRPSIVYGWLPGAIWPTLIMARVLCRGRRFAALRGVTIAAPWERRLIRLALSGADIVTINAPWLADEADQLGVPQHKLRYIPNGVELTAEVSADISAQPPTAVVVANFRWYKGHDTLIHALARLENPVHVRLLGEGDEREKTRTLAQDCGVGDRLTFVAYPPDVHDELRRAQFAIHPSRTEGLSNAILEELAAGLPVVATRVGGTPLLVDDGVEGFLVPPGDPDALAIAIDKLCFDPSLRAQMSIAAHAKASQFSWRACIDRYEALLFGAGEQQRDRGSLP